MSTEVNSYEKEKHQLTQIKKTLCTIFSMLPVSFLHSFPCWFVPYSFPQCFPCLHPSFLSPWKWGSAIDSSPDTAQHTWFYSSATSLFCILPQRETPEFTLQQTHDSTYPWYYGREISTGAISGCSPHIHRNSCWWAQCPQCLPTTCTLAQVFSLVFTIDLAAVAQRWPTILPSALTNFKDNVKSDTFSSNPSEDIYLLSSCLPIHLCDYVNRPKIISTTTNN